MSGFLIQTTHAFWKPASPACGSSWSKGCSEAILLACRTQQVAASPFGPRWLEATRTGLYASSGRCNCMVLCRTSATSHRIFRAQLHAGTSLADLRSSQRNRVIHTCQLHHVAWKLQVLAEACANDKYIASSPHRHEHMPKTCRTSQRCSQSQKTSEPHVMPRRPFGTLRVHPACKSPKGPWP